MSEDHSLIRYLIQRVCIRVMRCVGFVLVVLFIAPHCKSANHTDSKSSVATTYKVGKKVNTIDENIWTIFQDQSNRYWYGSNDMGVYIHDSTGITLITMADGLLSNSIRGIQEDHLGNIYIESPAGVNRYDGNTIQTLEPIPGTNQDWKLTHRDLWFKCNGNPNHVYRYDGVRMYELSLPQQDLEEAFGGPVAGLSFRDMNDSPYSVYGINKDSEGNIWFGTITAGAFRFDGTSFLWIGESELSQLPDGRVPGVRSIIQDKNGYFWLSNFLSKYRIVKSKNLVGYERLDNIDPTDVLLDDRLPYFNSGLVDSRGDLWMITYGGGVWHYDGFKLHNFPIYHEGKKVLLISLYQDNKGVLWLGTQNGGIFKYDGLSFQKFEV